ncbi:cytochrome c [Chloroflexi bacterium TSY]|nr:cytochrome c [Chloroflexi bacterium TSY]
MSAVLFLLVACSPSGGTSGSVSDNNTAANGKKEIPTMPAARFTSVGNQSDTSNVRIETPAPAEEHESEIDLALGERVYNNHCAECHGELAVGGSAQALAGLAMELAELETLLRTGGELGPEHLFGTRKVSANGMTAMHGYLQALREE